MYLLKLIIMLLVALVVVALGGTFKKMIILGEQELQDKVTQVAMRLLAHTTEPVAGERELQEQTQMALEETEVLV
jgi:hypothetical protein